MSFKVVGRLKPAYAAPGKIGFTLVSLAALMIGQSTQAADPASVPTIDWLSPAADTGMAVPRLSVTPSAVETVGGDTFVIDDAMPPESAEAAMSVEAMSVEAMSAGRPAVAEPVLIPVRSALSIGGVMLALLAPVLRHGRARRMFR